MLMYFMKYCICCYLIPGFVEGMPTFSWYALIQFGCQRLYRDYCFSSKHIIHVVFYVYKVYSLSMFIVMSDVFLNTHILIRLRLKFYLNLNMFSLKNTANRQCYIS